MTGIVTCSIIIIIITSISNSSSSRMKFADEPDHLSTCCLLPYWSNLPDHPPGYIAYIALPLPVFSLCQSNFKLNHHFHCISC